MENIYVRNIHEYGKENDKVVVLIHPSIVRWDYFEAVIPLLQERYHLIIPALPGYDPDSDIDFSSVEEIAGELGTYLRNRGLDRICVVYGCSMGGSIALRMVVDHKVKIERIVMDGGITPYQLPRIVTRLILLRDFAMLAIGKLGGEKMLFRAFATGAYGRDEVRYLAECFRNISYRTLWRTFDSCNNYSMPKRVMRFSTRIEYWCADQERKERSWDIRYMKRFIPQTQFRRIRGVGHGGLAIRKPERLARVIRKLAG